jgi:2-oxoisovalerate ferredoxin oxidoreductase beta subunit
MSEYKVVESKTPVFFERFERKAENQHQTHYCPGCGHGVAQKLIAEALGELGVQDRTIMVSPVGCSVFIYYYFDTGNVQASHGRAPAVATGLKRAHPESIVVAYQGDGDLAAIGTSEIIHAANRGENITVFFVNNSIYGMTGGQMAPTTLVGQVSTTTPWGRRPNNDGFPIKMAELISTLEAPVYVERVALCSNKHIMQARKAVKKALELQKQGAGFTMVEILSPCPTILKMEPTVARRWVGETLAKQFPLGVFRDRRSEFVPVEVPQKSVAELLGITERRSRSGGICRVPGCEAQASDNEHHAQGRNTRPITLKVAGFGGQGVLLLGQLIAEMGMREHMEVSWLPSYGPEMRSGSAHCHVTLSHQRIGTPLVSRPQVLVAMNEPSLRKFGATIQAGGVLLYNGHSLPEDLKFDGVTVACVPANEIANQIGSAKVANVVMMGALLQATNCLPFTTALEVLRGLVKNPKLAEMNEKALAAGQNYLVSEIPVGAMAEPDGRR